MSLSNSLGVCMAAESCPEVEGSEVDPSEEIIHQIKPLTVFSGGRGLIDQTNP